MRGECILLNSLQLLLHHAILIILFFLTKKKGIRESGGTFSTRDSLLLKEEEIVGESREYPYHTLLFQAMVMGSLIDQNTYAMRTYWSDITHDHRGAFVRYALLIPTQEREVIQAVAAHPEVLFGTFRQVYSGFDNSAKHGHTLQFRQGDQFIQFRDLN